ncbi:hypothetical protein QTP70_021388 [Hemibagrus guttatus]|uniref:Uncharacterized protein n=1 Tax=Hemibagrus guttatus TaxID=175788 RepID=A0AAE0QJE5_9TELE|nr:hypothetical protein QTP70_021388 [Hemibagrus guttatus]
MSNGDKKRNVKSAQEHAGRPSNEDVLHDLWDSLESDTESLVQEKAYLRELQKRILNGEGESSYSNNDKIERSEYEEGCDSQPAVTETCEDQNTKYSRQTSPWDEYADLRYDPNWRKKLAWSEFPQTDLFDPNEDPADGLRHTGHVSPRRRHEYLIVHSPVSPEKDAVHPKPLQSSFHLHPPEDQDTVLSVPQHSSASVERMPRSNSVKPMNFEPRSDAGILPFSSPRQRQHDRQKQSIAQEQNRDNLNAVVVQRKHTQKVRSPKLKEDIIERNKATLGINSHKQGSYRKAYEQRGGKSDDSNQPLQSAEDTASSAIPGSPDNVLNLEQMWIQKAQKLKVHNRSKHLDRAKPHRQRTKPKAPTVNPNINLNTSATLAEPFIDHEPQKQLYTYPPSSHWRIRNDEFNSCFKGPSYPLCPPVPPGGTLDHESTRLTNKINIRCITYVKVIWLDEAYTVKDYKSLIWDVKLGGLGPSNAVAVDVAEKIRQQKLYSNVVREQNKKISRIPCLLTKNPVGRDNKNNDSRNKALEYAKTVAKPKAPQQLKERPKDKSESERVFQHTAYHQLGTDLTQLSTLEMLRIRHEQEKQVVARFTNVHGRSSAPSVSSH